MQAQVLADTWITCVGPFNPQSYQAPTDRDLADMAA